MKRVLSLVLALVMVLGMIPTFAAEMTGGEHLLDHGFITGKPGDDVATKLDAGAALTRQELAALIAELMGEKEIAAVFAQPADYADADKIGAWAVPFVAYAQVNGWMSGKPGNMFDPTGPVPGQQLAAVLMNALGYTVDTEAKYATVIADAAALGLAVPSGNLTRGAAFEAMWVAVSEINVNGEEQTLGVKLGKLDPPAPVVTELMVSSMATTNYKEVVITFNQDVDATEAAKEANYAITGNTVAEATVNGAVVVLTLGTEIAPQGSIEVTVKKAVGLTEDYKYKVENVIDAVPPSVAGVTVYGNKQLVIKFSEPVKEGFTLLSTYKINGNFFAASAPTISADRKEVTLNVTNRLPAGEHKLVVANTVKDYAGFSLIPNETAFVVATDAVAPVVSTATATQTKLTVTFNEEIETPALTDIVPTVGTVTGVSVKGEVLTVTFNVASPLPTTATEITLKNITDMYGNKATDLKINVAATPDLVRPEFVSATVIDQKTIVVEFSKDVNLDGTYTLKDADGKLKQVNGTETALAALSHYVKDAVTYNNKVVLKLVGDVAFKATSYTLTVSDVTDVNPLSNKVLPVVSTVVVPDKVAPTFTIQKDIPNNKLYVVFDKKVDATTALTKANYNYLLGTFTALNADTTVKLLADGKTVEVAFPTTGTNAVVANDITSFQVSGVKDESGNVVVTQAIASGAFTAIPVQTVLSAPKVTGKNTVVMTVTGGLVASTLTVSDFVVKNTDVPAITLNPINIAYDADKNTLTLTINENISAIAEYDSASLTIETIATPNAKDIYGRSVAVLGATAIVDAFAPTVTFTSAIAATDLVTLTFSEDVEILGDALLSTADLTVAGVKSQFVVMVNNVTKAFNLSSTVDNVLVVEVLDGGFAATDTVRVIYYPSPSATDFKVIDATGNDNALATFDLSKAAQ